jgi:broad specificity phosphatase PhoE
MGLVHFITHPDVAIDPAIPVPDWPLSGRGRMQMKAFADRVRLHHLTTIISSAERKARDGAAILGAAYGLSPIVIAGLGENDRSATGYLPREQFEALADAFFARPDESVQGWERATDAQRRIIAAVDDAVALVSSGDLAIISHGAVGALLLCHLMGVPISRAWDQPGEGGGNAYAFDATTRRLQGGWQRLEDYSPV